MTRKYDFLLPKDWPTVLGRKMVLMGTSEDGPYMQPTVIRHKDHARQIFGNEDQGNLVKAFDQAYDRNEDISIYLMRITGKSATLNIEGIDPEVEDIYEDDLIDPDTYVEDEPKVCLHLYTIYAGEKYNEYSAWMTEDEITEERVFYLATPTDQITYVLSSEVTLGSFIRTINEDCRNGVHSVMATTDYPDETMDAISPFMDEPIFFEDGETGTDTTKNDLYLACDLAYQILQGRPIDTVVPVGMYVDDVHPAWLYGSGVYGSAYYSSTSDYLQLLDTYDNNKVVSFHEQLIEFCRQQMRLGYMSHGVIGLRPFKEVPVNVENDNSYIARLAQSTAFKDRHGFIDYANGAWYDKGYFVTVVGMDLIFQTPSGQEYYDNGASRYAAMLTGHYDSTTNMPIGDDVRLRYELSEYTLLELSKLGVVTFRDSVRKGLVVTSGITAASPDAELHNVANVRMVQITLAYMNDAVELVYENDFDSGMRRNFLEQEVRTRLSLLSELKVITAYDYEIRYRADDIKGEILLTLESKHTIEGIQTSAEISYREV